MDFQAGNDDAMQDAEFVDIPFSGRALVWLQQHHAKFEEMVRNRQRMWHLAEWEEFERWTNCQVQKLDEARDLRHEVSQLRARLARFEGTILDAPSDYRTGVYALDKLVREITRADAQDLPPADGGELVIDRFDKLVGFMTWYKNQLEADEWNPRYHLAANQGTHDFLRNR